MLSGSLKNESLWVFSRHSLISTVIHVSEYLIPWVKLTYPLSLFAKYIRFILKIYFCLCIYEHPPQYVCVCVYGCVHALHECRKPEGGIKCPKIPQGLNYR